MNLEELREKLAGIDRRILQLAADRRRLAHSIGKEKEKTGDSIRNFAQEKEVIERARKVACRVGVSEDLAQTLMEALIHESLTTQEKQRVRSFGKGQGRKALIIGGAGRMGRWFCTFLQSQGFRVEVADPAGPVLGYVHHARWEDVELDHEFILVATDLRVSQGILHAMAEIQPPGLILDIGSLKGPLSEPLQALSKSGCRIASIHPMFGPSTVLLSKRHIIFVDIGSRQATLEAKELFSSTMAELVDMSLEEHDRVIAYVLGISHALNIAFATALAESGESALELAEISSQTFGQQLSIAENVIAENPHLYYEIQALNKFSHESLGCLTRALEELARSVSTQEESTFVSLMKKGRDYLSGK